MQEYNICYSLDSAYAEQMTVSITSILKNSEIKDNINFYVLDGGLSKSDKSKIELLKNIKNFNITYIKVDNQDFKVCPLLKDKNDNYKNYHVSIPTYYRFKLPEYLSGLNKILYLDCDVIIRGSLKKLFGIKLTNKAAAMVLDAESAKEAQRLNIDNYFNAGVMLINLDFWRENNISQKLFDFAAKNQDIILWQDQDILNVVLKDKILVLDNIWNFQYFLYNKIDEKDFINCNILHLAGRFKPWLLPFQHSVYDDYYYYLSFTEWKNKIILYRQKAIGKYLKNNVGGKVTNIIMNATDEDIKKVYGEINKAYDFTKEQLKSFTSDTDVKITKVYDEITNNYDFTKNICEQAKNVILLDTDEKISKVYNEISKNYEYANSLADKSLKEIDERILQVNDEISKVNCKIDQVNNEVSKNNEFTASVIDETDKKFSNIVSEKENLFNTKITNIYEEITRSYSFTKDNSEETKKFLIDHTNRRIDSVYDEITKNYEYTNSLNALNKELVNEIKTDFNNETGNLKTEISVLQDNISRIDDEITDTNDSLKLSIEKTTRENEEKILQTEQVFSAMIMEVKSDSETNVQKAFDKISQNYESVKCDLEARSKENTIKITQSEQNFSEKITNIKSDLDKISKDNQLQITQSEQNLTEKFDGLNSKLNIEIEKTYNHINQLSEENILEFNQIKEDIVKQDNKLINIYDEISINKKSFENKLTNLHDNLQKFYADVNKGTDEKISLVQNYIAVAINQTEEKLNQTLKETQKELTCKLIDAKENIVSYIDNVEERINFDSEEKVKTLNKTFDEKIFDTKEQIKHENSLHFKEVYSYSNEQFSKLFKELKENSLNIENVINSKIYELYKINENTINGIEGIKNKLQKKPDVDFVHSLIENVQDDISNKDVQYQKDMQLIKNDYEEKLNKQRIKYENKLIAMENQISKIENDLSESKKGLIVKLIDKYCKAKKPRGGGIGLLGRKIKEVPD